MDEERLEEQEVEKKPISKKSMAYFASAIPALGVDPEAILNGEPVETTNEEVEESETEETEESTTEASEESNNSEEGSSTDFSAIIERLSPVVGEEQLSTGDGVVSALDTIVGELETLRSNKDTFESVTNLFEESDEIVQMAKYVKDGLSVNEAIARVINFDEWQEELKETDPEEYKKVIRAQVEREKAQEEARKAQEELHQKFTQNQSNSVKSWTEFKKEKGLEGEKAKKFEAEINGFWEQIAEGLVSKDFLEVFYKGLEYEDAVKKAVEEGKVNGKNEAIEQVKAKRKGDGTPDLQSRGRVNTTPKVSRGKKALGNAIGNSVRTQSSDWR